MEKLVHTAEGTLEVDDPYRKVGNEFWYTDRADGHRERTVVTEESARKEGAEPCRSLVWLCFPERGTSDLLLSLKKDLEPIEKD